MNTCGQPRCGRMSYPVPDNCTGNTRLSGNCTGNTRLPDNFALAMAYVPMQKLKSLYELDEALKQGTIFPELNKPFLGWKGGCPC